MTFPRIGTYSSLRGDGSPLLNHPDRIAKLARWDDVIIELGTLHEHPDIAAKLRASNPAIRLHAYVVMVYGDWPAPFFQDFKRIVQSTNGVLLGTDGKPWFMSNVNVARPATMDALADLILRYMQASNIWSGALVDILIPAFHAQPDIGWRQMGYSSYDEFEVKWNVNSEEFVRRLKSTGLPVSTNYGNSIPHVSNGNMREDFPNQFGNPGTWEANMVENQWGQPGQINLKFAEPRAGWICSAPYWGPMPVPEGHTPGPAGYFPLHPENQRRMRYHDASACLSGDYGSFGRYEWDEQWKAVRHTFFAPHYVHPQRGKGWLGEPTHPAEHVTLSNNKRVDLWERRLTFGRAVVNPSSEPHSIYFDRPYRPIGGVAKTGWSVPAHDGMLLEAV